MCYDEFRSPLNKSTYSISRALARPTSCQCVASIATASGSTRRDRVLPPRRGKGMEEVRAGGAETGGRRNGTNAFRVELLGSVKL